MMQQPSGEEGGKQNGQDAGEKNIRNIPNKLMMQLFVGTDIHLRTSVKQAFVHGMETALHVSVFMCLVATAMSLVRGQEVRRDE